MIRNQGPKNPNRSRSNVLANAINRGQTTSVDPEPIRGFSSASANSRPPERDPLNRLSSQLWSKREDCEVDPDQSLTYLFIEVHSKRYFVADLFLDKERFFLDFQTGRIPLAGFAS